MTTHPDPLEMSGYNAEKAAREARITHPEPMPCPFCDRPMMRIERTEDLCRYVICNTCGACGPCLQGHDVTNDDAIKAWNRRVPAVNAESAMREALAWFASIMERELKANDHKGGWQGDYFWDLIRRLHEEVKELDQVTPLEFDGKGARYDMHEVIKEAADVSNFAMMIADNARAALRGAP